IYNRDLNGIVRNDDEACALYKHCAAKHGLDLPYGSVYAGATDAAAFSMGGYKAVSVAAMNPTVQKYYHTRLDNYDNLSPECLEKVYDITMDFIDTFDKYGFNPPKEDMPAQDNGNN
ncbi:MAG: M28 family peptidase, partial [Clostridia bacterium]|nr:M28 family peptidase [Clostridia bacterium]